MNNEIENEKLAENTRIFLKIIIRNDILKNRYTENERINKIMELNNYNDESLKKRVEDISERYNDVIENIKSILKRTNNYLPISGARGIYIFKINKTAPINQA